jgi:hypothetical protein
MTKPRPQMAITANRDNIDSGLLVARYVPEGIEPAERIAMACQIMSAAARIMADAEIEMAMGKAMEMEMLAKNN